MEGSLLCCLVTAHQVPTAAQHWLSLAKATTSPLHPKSPPPLTPLIPSPLPAPPPLLPLHPLPPLPRPPPPWTRPAPKLDDLIITQRKELSNFFCFPTADHEILTDRGFLSYTTVKHLLSTNKPLRIACPTLPNLRHTGHYTLQYHPISSADLIQAHSSHLVHFSSRSSAVDLLVTDNHRMLVRLGRREGMGGRWQVPYVRADEVAESGEEAVQLLCHASGGLEQVERRVDGCESERRSRLLFSEVLGLASVGEEDAFIEVYGRWHSCGRLQKVRGLRSVCLSVRNQAESDEVEAVLRRLPLTRRDKRCREQRQAWMEQANNAGCER